MSSNLPQILPGSTIGILGGGQLGRMSAIAAANMGYKTCVLCPETDPPAAQVCNTHIQADYQDQAALKTFAETVDVVTLEFENIPTATLDFLSTLVPVRPSTLVLDKTQDRFVEKQFVTELGIGTAPFADLSHVPDNFVFPGILKTRRMGYDGKGQAKVSSKAELLSVWKAMGSPEAIIEGLVNFDFEISIIVARNPSGQIQTFPTVRNEHVGGVLSETFAPSGVSTDLEAKASDLAHRIAEALQLEGLLAVELFVTVDQQLLVNELAPRPHNSGHWSMDGAATSQFEQHIRAVCDLPLGSTDILKSTRMHNLLGDVSGIEACLDDPRAHLHLYGKGEAKPGRKMGHINYVG